MFYLQGVSDEAPEEYVNYLLMKELGWTWRELMETPRSVVERLLIISTIHHKVRK